MGIDIDTGERQVSRGRRRAASYAVRFIPVTKSIRQGLRLWLRLLATCFVVRNSQIANYLTGM